MTLNGLEQDIISTVAEKLEMESDKISLESTFEELGADRLYKIVVVDSIEDKYNIVISNRDFEGFLKVGDVVNYLMKNLTSPKETIPDYSI